MICTKPLHNDFPPTLLIVMGCATSVPVLKRLRAVCALFPSLLQTRSGEKKPDGGNTSLHVVPTLREMRSVWSCAPKMMNVRVCPKLGANYWKTSLNPEAQLSALREMDVVRWLLFCDMCVCVMINRCFTLA